MVSTCTQKPTNYHYLCVILKKMHVGIGWVWLVRLRLGVVFSLILSLLPSPPPSPLLAVRIDPRRLARILSFWQEPPSGPV